MSDEVVIGTQKQFWKSKTFWVSILTSLLGIVPGAKEFIIQYPEAVMGLLGVIFNVLRFVTKDKIVIG